MSHEHHHPDAHGGRRGSGTAIEAPDSHTMPAADPATGGRSGNPDAGRGGWAGLWHALTAVIAGIAPHVLHHIGLFAGAFLVTGATGNLLFGAAGLLLSIPLLRRLYRRFGTWKAPAIAVGVFAVMFSVSAFVIGPAISGSDAPPPAPTSGQDVLPEEHTGHHD